MSEHLSWYRSGDTLSAVLTPTAPEALVRDWGKVRSAMARTVAPGFSRDEWAYLMGFLAADNLYRPFHESFGTPVEAPATPPERLFHPRGPIAVWLPSNVSLLGPLTLVLLSLTGQPLRLKLGSAADDLSGAFLCFARDCLADGPLAEYLEAQVRAEVFSRGDEREREMAAEAEVRIVFGGDAAAKAIHALPQPVDSVGVSFTDRRSEAWLHPSAIDDDTLTNLLRVFAIYGQAGCTSPSRVVLLDATPGELGAVFERLCAVANRTLTAPAPMHVASENLMADQWARALGWHTALTPGNAAMLARGDPGLEDFEAHMALKLVAADTDAAFAALPANIQTIGHALSQSPDDAWLARLAQHGVARFVPLAQMHHFSSTWDGTPFWLRCFDVMEVQ